MRLEDSHTLEFYAAPSLLQTNKRGREWHNKQEFGGKGFKLDHTLISQQKRDQSGLLLNATHQDEAQTFSSPKVGLFSRRKFSQQSHIQHFQVQAQTLQPSLQPSHRGSVSHHMLAAASRFHKEPV